MVLKQGLCAFVILFSVLQLVESNTCVLRPLNYCTNQCFQNLTTCLCEAEGDIEHCKQICDHPHATICPNVVCRGGKTCRQFCGKALCNMTCSENSEYCHQNCSSPGQCDVLKCSSAQCVQSCSNCTMLCTEEVQECQQICLSGSCQLECNARNCINECENGNKTRCDVQSSGRVNGEGRVSRGSLMSLVTFIITVFSLLTLS